MTHTDYRFRTVDCCKRFCEAVWDGGMAERDRGINPTRWDNEEYEKKGKLKIGYFVR